MNCKHPVLKALTTRFSGRQAGALVFCALALVTLPSMAGTAFGASESSTAGPEVAGLEGSVGTGGGEPLVGALVSIFGSNLGSAGLIAFTDEKGRFRIAGLEPGWYSIRTYLSGFLPSHYARVEVDDAGSAVTPISVQMAPSDENQIEERPHGEPTALDDYQEKVAEFQWLLRHGKRNVLHQQAADGGAEEDVVVEEVVVYPAEPSGELGLFAFERGLHDFPTSPGEVDAQLAYARFNIPTGPASEWIVSAQLLESALSSWAAQAEFVTESSPGQQISAGVAYGNHTYGDFDGSPAPLGGMHDGPATGSRTSEWFGSVFGAHRFRIGAADVGAGLTYHHYSYLDRSSYAAPRLDVSLALDDASTTFLRGLFDYRVLAPGGEDLDLLARMVSADFLGTAERGERGLTAETTVRYQVSVERGLGGESAVEVRVFQENVRDSLLKAYLKRPGSDGAPGHYLVMNRGDMLARGVGLTVSREFGGVVGSLGYTFGMGRALNEDVGAFEAAKDERIHDLTTTVRTEIDQTHTRVLAVYYLSKHPSLAPSVARRGTEAPQGAVLDSRFNLQVHQLLPFFGWNSTEWELVLAVRNLFYEDVENGLFIDEISVVEPPARVMGGVTVHF